MSNTLFHHPTTIFPTSTTTILWCQLRTKHKGYELSQFKSSFQNMVKITK